MPDAPIFACPQAPREQIRKKDQAMKNIWKICSMGAGVVLFSGCGAGESEACQSSAYPAAPDGATSLVHVSSACSGEGADGTIEHPYAKISDAVNAVPKGSSVLIAPGTYAESLQIKQDIALVGSSDGTKPEQAGAIVQPPTGSGVTVDGATVLIRGLAIESAAHSGIAVHGGSVTVEGCRVTGTKLDGADFGHGVSVSSNGSIILQHNAISGSAGAGVFVRDSAAIILQNEIDKSEVSGVRLEHASSEVRVEHNTLTNNAQAGISVYSSRAIILQNTIHDTRLDANGFGEGIAVSDLLDTTTMMSLGPSDITVKDNELVGTARVGILCLGPMARGIILQHNIITGSGAVAAKDNHAIGAAGVWLQGGAGSGAGSVIDSNTITGSSFFGLGLSGDTHAIILQNNAVKNTALASAFSGAQQFMVGDGITMSDGASAQITANNASGNGRFGIIVDAAKGTATTISGNEFNDNDQYGIILQNQPSAPDTTNNTTTGNKVGKEQLNPAVPYPMLWKSFAAP